MKLYRAAIIQNNARNYVIALYVTGPEKTGLIYTKYTHPYYGIYLLLCVCYPNSVSFIEILRIFCIYGEMIVKIVS